MEKRGGQRIWTDGKKWGTEKARRQEKHGRDKRTEVEDETENEISERSDEMERLIGKNRIEDSRFFQILKKQAFPFFSTGHFGKVG